MSEIAGNGGFDYAALQAELAKIDPSANELDITDPDVRIGMMIMKAMMTPGVSIEFSAENDDGSTETIKFESIGDDAANPLTSITIANDSGRFSDGAVDMLMPAFENDHRAEVEKLIGE